jgi:hypothetical protein
MEESREKEKKKDLWTTRKGESTGVLPTWLAAHHTEEFHHISLSALREKKKRESIVKDRGERRGGKWRRRRKKWKKWKRKRRKRKKRRTKKRALLRGAVGVP